MPNGSKNFLASSALMMDDMDKAVVEDEPVDDDDDDGAKPTAGYATRPRTRRALRIIMVK
jgi:hypothetical protein